MKFNILKWCDDKITQLKENDISFENGVAVMPKDFIYQDEVSMVSTYKYRNDIPDGLKKTSLLTYFMPDDNLFNRIKKLEDEIYVLKEYGGICGFDLSPSVGMLRPRQRFSILINSVFNAYCGTCGIKILPNSRVGDLGTMSMTNSFPQGVNFITGKHGCNSYGFKGYGLYQLCVQIHEKQPHILYVYGSVSLKEARHIFRYSKDIGFNIITFPDRRNRVRNKSQPHRICIENNKLVKKIYEYGGRKDEC
ncbi:MAG: hypothetical protein PUE21_02065 [Lachnospiraceae bacterium]|nr:hypothetical protein [Lachnospiraceae bacterium]